jgi:4-alpha-glucanotransferase
MCILQFGFGNRGAHSYLPHSFDRNTVVYTGTHDNDTTLGWWQNGATAEERAAIETYLSLGEDGPVWALIRAASASVADMCLFPLQDILGLGSEARMNVPSAAEGNWSWRFEQQWLSSELAEKLRAITDVADRTLSARLELEQNAQQRQDDERRLGF